MYKPLDNFLKQYECESNLVIWKYMPLDYFIYLLETQTLYLPRADNNPVYFEGQLIDEDTKKLADSYEKNNSKSPLKEAKDSIAYFEKLKSCTYIDSWHYNDNECFAMWKIFGKSNNAVALKSKVDKLREVYNSAVPDCSLSKVYYYKATETIDIFNRLLMFIRKPIFFDYEKEIRGIVQYPFEFNKTYQKSVHISIENFNEFIDEIVVSPYSSEWLLKIIKNLLQSKKLNDKCVNDSSYRIKNDNL
jgi:hypothetical protein